MPKGNESTTKFNADISQLKSAMQEAARSVRLANSEFKAATSGMDKWSDTADGLNAKVKQLGKVLEAQNKQLHSLEEQYRLTAEEQGENSKSAQELLIKINNQKAAIGKTESQLKSYSDKLDNMGKEADDAGDDAEDLAKQMAKVDEAAQKTSDGFTVMKGALASLVADGIRTAIGAVKDFAKETMQVGMTFESSMSQVKAVSGASGEELEALTEKAKEMGAKTKFSASESADAFNYMAMAGWKTKDMLGGIEGVMNLAAASGEDLATTSDIVTDALTAMGYQAKDAGRLADVMAAASSNANTNVGMMGQTFQYAAPIVGALGYNMEDTAVAIGMMANAGIKADKAGTALRSILTRLSAPPSAAAKAMKALNISIKESDGTMKPLNKILVELRKKFAGLSKEQQTNNAKALAGQEAMSGLLAIVNGSDADFKKLTKAVNESSGAAQNMADTMNDNLQGQLTILRSQIEGKMIQVFEKVGPKVREAIDQISIALDAVDWNKVADGAANFGQKVASLMAYIISNGGTIITIVKTIAIAFTTLWAANKYAQFIGGLNSLITTLSSTQKAVELLKASQLGLNAAQLASPVGLVVTGIAALTAALVYASVKTRNQIKEQYGLTAEQEKTIQTTNKLAESYKQMDKARTDATSKVTAEYGHLEELKKEYNSLIDSNGKVKKGYEDRANFILDQLAKSMGVERSEIKKLIDKNGKLGDSIDKLMLKKKAEAMLNANQDAYDEAIQKRGEALKTYQANVKSAAEAEKTYKKAHEESSAVMSKYNEMLQTVSYESARAYIESQHKIISGEIEAKKAYEDASKSLKKSEEAYVGYNSTVSNYEALSAASISGNSKKISSAIDNLQNKFVTAKDGTKRTLEQQVKDTQANLKSIEDAYKNKTPGITKANVDAARKAAEGARLEYEKANPEAKKAGEKLAKQYAAGMDLLKGNAYKSGNLLGKNAVNGEKAGGKSSKKAGTDNGESYSSGVKSKTNEAKKAGSNLGTSTATGARNGSGMNANGTYNTIQYVHGVNSKAGDAKSAGKNLADNANAGAKSVDSRQSGSFFGEGFFNGIGSWIKSVWDRGFELARSAWNGLRKGQKEGSPSKLTRQSGVFFAQGFINGINSMHKSLVNTTTKFAGVAVKDLLNMTKFDFSGSAQTASEKFASAFSKKLDYITSKMSYQNERQLATFDSKISKLEKTQSKKITDAEKRSTKKQTTLEKQKETKLAALQKKYDSTKDKNQKKRLKREMTSIKNSYSNKIKAEKNHLKNQKNTINKTYNNLIAKENKNKEAYQQASSSMLSEFSTAMSEYQTSAQNLIDTTMNGITEKYQAKYDALISKQDSLIEKMKSAGELFEISGAGVITVNDINEQTKQIQEYAAKLQAVKEKVSSDLFDQIASYDMKEGSAFMDQLLNMSEADLKAYSDAYDKKMSLAESLGTSIYKSDFDKLKKEYKDAVNEAFKDIPKQLEKLGKQSMQGFINGLRTNTDYMTKEVKSYVNSMIKIFKKELGIHSPSKVMAEIGEYTGEGFAIGLRDTIGSVKKSASTLVEATSASLSDVKSALTSGLAANGSSVGGSIINNYNLVQNNNSPKSLSALETYQARRQQIALVKALT